MGRLSDNNNDNELSAGIQKRNIPMSAFVSNLKKQNFEKYNTNYSDLSNLI